MNLPHCRFGDTPDQQDRLASLILDGVKTATCSALIDYLGHPEKLPHPGDQLVVENGQGQAVCTIEITDVVMKRFDEIDADFARCEGEGDRTLHSWHTEHRRYFTAQSIFAPDMTLVCEWFKVIDPAS